MFLITHVLLVNEVLDLSLQLNGQFTHLWRNDLAQDLIHSRSRLQELGDRFVEFDAVLLARHRNLRVVRDLLKGYGLGRVFSRLEMIFRLLKLLHV